MTITLPEGVWAMIAADRINPDKRVFAYAPPKGGIYLASWLRQFVRAHHDLPIAWPDGNWWIAHEADSYASRKLTFSPHARALLKARAETDGEPQAAVLRRLLVQHFGRVPPNPVRITGGLHARTLGQGPDCTSCIGMIAMSRAKCP